MDTNGIITTVAGSGPTGIGVGSFSGDVLGLRQTPPLYGPAAVAVDAFGNLFIADSLNNRIRKVDTNGNINTVAGNGTAGFGGDGGPGTAANLCPVYGVSVDPAGNLFISDIGNNPASGNSSSTELSTHWWATAW